MTRNRDGILTLIAMALFFVFILGVGLYRGSVVLPLTRDVTTLAAFTSEGAQLDRVSGRVDRAPAPFVIAY